MSKPALQAKSSRADRVKPWQWKKGQSGNPSGRKAGKSMKEYAKELLAKMTMEEREKFLHGLDKDKIWEMAEGKAKADGDMNLTGEISVKIVKYGDRPTAPLQPEEVSTTDTQGV